MPEKAKKGEWVVRANGRDRNLIRSQFLDESLTAPGAIAVASSEVWRITQLTWPIDKGKLGSQIGQFAKPARLLPSAFAICPKENCA